MSFEKCFDADFVGLLKAPGVILRHDRERGFESMNRTEVSFSLAATNLWWKYKIRPSPCVRDFFSPSFGHCDLNIFAYLMREKAVRTNVQECGTK